MLPALTLAVLYPFVRNRSRRAKRLAVTASLGSTALWGAWVTLENSHWRFDSTVAIVLPAMVFMVACSYPMLEFWDRQRERVIEANSRPHTPQQEIRGRILLFVVGLLFVLFIGSIIWSAWN